MKNKIISGVKRRFTPQLELFNNKGVIDLYAAEIIAYNDKGVELKKAITSPLQSSKFSKIIFHALLDKWDNYKDNENGIENFIIDQSIENSYMGMVYIPVSVDLRLTNLVDNTRKYEYVSKIAGYLLEMDAANIANFGDLFTKLEDIITDEDNFTDMDIKINLIYRLNTLTYENDVLIDVPKIGSLLIQFYKEKTDYTIKYMVAYLPKSIRDAKLDLSFNGSIINSELTALKDGSFTVVNTSTGHRYPLKILHGGTSSKQGIKMVTLGGDVRVSDKWEPEFEYLGIKYKIELNKSVFNINDIVVGGISKWLMK